MRFMVEKQTKSSSLELIYIKKVSEKHYLFVVFLAELLTS